MNSRWAKRLAILITAVLLGILGMGAVGAQTPTSTTPGSTTPEDRETITVTKTVVGTAPADASFVLHVRCDAPNNETVINEDVTLGTTGGSKDFVIAPSKMLDCKVSETRDGGAAAVRSCAGLLGTTPTCSDTGTVSVGVVSVAAPTIVDITNTFTGATTTTRATTTTATAQVAPPVAAASTFTG